MLTFKIFRSYIQVNDDITHKGMLDRKVKKLLSMNGTYLKILNTINKHSQKWYGGIIDSSKLLR